MELGTEAAMRHAKFELRASGVGAAPRQVARSETFVDFHHQNMKPQVSYWYLGSLVVRVSSMTNGGTRESGEQDVEWLTPEQLESWLSVVRMMTWLPWSIDQQLQRDSKLRMVEYQVLAMLSERPQRTMRMSALADVTNASLSRLSHLVDRMEKKRWVCRESDPSDGRFTNAILTDKGFEVLAAAAPGHLRHVRSLVVDVLTPEQLRRLGRDAGRIMARIDTSVVN